MESSENPTFCNAKNHIHKQTQIRNGYSCTTQCLPARPPQLGDLSNMVIVVSIKGNFFGRRRLVMRHLSSIIYKNGHSYLVFPKSWASCLSEPRSAGSRPVPPLKMWQLTELIPIPDMAKIFILVILRGASSSPPCATIKISTHVVAYFRNIGMFLLRHVV